MTTKPKKKHKLPCHNCKKPGHYQNQGRQLKRDRNQSRINTKSADKSNNINSGRASLTPTKKFQTIPTETTKVFKKTQDLDLSTHTVRTVIKLTIPQRNRCLDQTQRIDSLPGTPHCKDKIKSNGDKATQMVMLKLQPKL